MSDNFVLTIDDIAYFKTYDGMRIQEYNSALSYLMKFVGQTFMENGVLKKITVLLTEGDHNEIMYIFRSVDV